MNDRRKIPDGHREKSSRSSPSSSCTPILVLAATDAREISRRSRSARSLRPGLSVTLTVPVFLQPLLADGDARKFVGGGAGNPAPDDRGNGTDGHTCRDDRR